MKQATGSNTPQSINKVSIQLTLDGHSFSAPALSGEFPGDGPVEVELLTPRTTLVPEEFFDEACAGELLAAAGMAAHLAGAMAAGTTLPVIGIPIASARLDGLDALLSTVQMPSGIPVATVAIDGAKNAAILAVQMLALSDAALTEKLEAFRAKGTAEALEKDRLLNSKA